MAKKAKRTAAKPRVPKNLLVCSRWLLRDGQLIGELKNGDPIEHGRTKSTYDGPDIAFEIPIPVKLRPAFRALNAHVQHHSLMKVAAEVAMPILAERIVQLKRERGLN